MKIIPSTESVLVVEITDALQKAVFDKMQNLVFPKNWDNKLMEIVDDKFRDYVNDVLDGQRFSSLIEYFIKIKILSSGMDYPIKGPKKLVSIKGFEDSLDVSRKIVEEIKKTSCTIYICDPSSRRI